MNLIRKRSDQRAKEIRERRENRRARYAIQRNIGSHGIDQGDSHIYSRREKYADTMVSGFHFHEFDFFKVILEVLRSLTSDAKMRKFIGNMLMDTFIASRPKNFVSIVTWPHMMEGIMKQLDIDLPREQVFLNSYPWPCQQDGSCWALYEALDEKVGPLWARMTCAFLNQAPTADFFKYVWKDAQEKYGQETIVCEKKESAVASPLKLHVTARSDNLSIVYVKEFRVLQGHELCETRQERQSDEQHLGDREKEVLVNYRITFFPTFSAHLFWQYK